MSTRKIKVKDNGKYIETNPNEEYIKNEIINLKQRVSFRMAEYEYEEKKSKKENAKLRRLYEKQFEIPKLKEQIKTLKFILRQ